MSSYPPNHTVVHDSQLNPPRDDQPTLSIELGHSPAPLSLENDERAEAMGTPYDAHGAALGKRKRARSGDNIATASGQLTTKDESSLEEEVQSIDVCIREGQRAKKSFRREILISSPLLPSSPADDDDVVADELSDKNKGGLAFDSIPVDLMLHVFSFLIEGEDFENICLVSKRWMELCKSISLWKQVSSINKDSGVNWKNFENLGIKNTGTEGVCYKVRQRSTGRILAMKKARVFPLGEGVPYYMLRELAVLKGMDHPNIASLEMVNLAKNKLHVFFPFIEYTLHDIVNPGNDVNGGTVIPEHQARRLLHQLLDAIAYCHRRGVLHRNLKPKHLLISKGSDGSLDDATLKISDFALVRATGYPRRVYTTEVVTLWYRPPEILMGVKGYSPAVDIWSIGCIFAEMAQGKPLFTGISEVDQLFQIFSKLSTPNDKTWPGFGDLPNCNFSFPNWQARPIRRLFPNLSEVGLDLLARMLHYDPERRITAEEALRHPFFNSTLLTFRQLTPHVSPGPMKTWFRGTGLPQVHEHVHLYHSYLRDSENRCCPGFSYLNKQKNLRPMHRSMLVDWLIEVVDVFEMCLRTAFLAVSYTDRFLEVVQVPKKKFQLLGATCLHVASKCEDVSYIGVDDLAMCADNVYQSLEVLDMEETLLNTLDFCLAVPTVLDFIHIFQEMIPPLSKKTQMLALYLSELALQEYQFLKYRPSLVATCILSLAMYCIDRVCWTPELQRASCYIWAELQACMVELQQIYSASPFTMLLVVRKRYSKEDRLQVAMLPPPTEYNMNW